MFGLRPSSERKRIAWWQYLRFRFHAWDLKADHNLRRLSDELHTTYEATGEDPQFRLKSPLPKGWYMAEVHVHCEPGIAQTRFYLDYGDGESEEHSHSLICRNGKISKRLIYLAQPARLRFDPTTTAGNFELRHFRLVRMSKKAAISRLKLKVKRHTPFSTFQENDLNSMWRAYDGLFASGSSITTSYQNWIEQIENHQILTHDEQHYRIISWNYRPLISVIVPTWNTPEELLRQCLESVLNQTYPHWQLCIADDASTQPQVRRVLQEFTERDPRIQVCFRESNGHICEASNSALRFARGEFIALLDHDDTLATHALFSMVEALQNQPNTQLLYSDEDKLDPEGNRHDPYFKPDWSPDLLLSQNYICHLSMYRRALVEKVGGFRRGYEGSQDYDLLLRCVEHLKHPGDILHVPKILYHWRQSEHSTARNHQAKTYTTQAAVMSLQDHLKRTGSDAATISIIEPGLYRVHRPLPTAVPLVSLIIPTRDGYDVLRTCISSILEKTEYPSYEILIIDNQSTDPETIDYLDTLQNHSSKRIRVMQYDRPFNYSAINNMATQYAKGSVLGLINNDIEIISPNWLGEMVSHALRPEIGCVGAKLYYPDGAIQHAGVVLGIGGVAGHSHKYFPGHAHGYFGRLKITHNVSAVTGAALLLRKAVFDQVGGLNEADLKVAFNDVDLCLKVQEAGYRNVWTPFAELYHHESKTRGTDSTPEKQARFAGERDYMIQRWGHILYQDPFYNPNLTLADESYGLSSMSRTSL